MAKGDLIAEAGITATGAELIWTPGAGIDMVVVSGGSGSGVADMDVSCNYGIGQNFIMLAVEGFQGSKILVPGGYNVSLTNNNAVDQGLGMCGVQLS